VCEETKQRVNSPMKIVTSNIVKALCIIHNIFENKNRKYCSPGEADEVLDLEHTPRKCARVLGRICKFCQMELNISQNDTYDTHWKTQFLRTIQNNLPPKCSRSRVADSIYSLNYEGAMVAIKVALQE